MRLIFPCSHVIPKRLRLVILYNIFFILIGGVVTTHAQAPTITSFSPTTICPGETVTITGTNFTGATSVLLGSMQATNVMVVSATTITANVADLSTSGTVSVTTPDGTVTGGGNLTISSAPRPELTDPFSLYGPFSNCDGNSSYELRVSNNSVVTGTGNIYEIDWGDNTPHFIQTDWGIGDQTTHTYTAQGYFPIVITITAPNGCSRTETYRFYNGKNPIASFTTSTSTTGLCIPAPVEFQIGNWIDNTPGTTYVINFGDGTPNLTLQHPLNATNTTHLLTHIYNTSSCPGAYDFTATLRVINGCFTTTYTLDQIIIRQKPIANFRTNPNAPCENESVCFINETVSGYSGNTCNPGSLFTWDFGDGTTVTGVANPCHTYTAAGTYNVTLTASNSTCGGDAITKQVVVSPISPLPVPVPAVYCVGETAAPLSATGIGLLWYTAATGGAGSPTAPTPSTNLAGTRTYYVSQMLPDHCESPRVPVAVTVNALPPAPGVTTPVQLCLNQPTTPLTATGAGLLWYTSATGGTGSATAPTPSTAAVDNTTYYVSQTVNDCEGPRAAILVTVSPLPVAPVTAPVIYCQHESAVPLTAAGTGLLWYTTATGGVGSSAAPTPSTATPGSTIYYVSQATGCGESPRASITVTVSERPSATISYTPSILCNAANSPAAPVTFSGTPGGVYSITPATGLSIDAATGMLNPSGATAGTYTIRYTVPGAGGCPDYITTTTVTVNSTPVASIAYPAICTSDGPIPVSLTGTSGGVFTSTAGLIIDPSTGIITPATSTPGTYTVTYEIAASAPCPGYTTTTNVTVTPAPSATISYTPAILCNVVNSPTTPVIFSGTPGGVYSITPATGLPINATTGEIQPSGAVAGVYMIRYTIPGAGGCADYATTTTVTINSAPTAVINYAGPYCGSITAPQPVTFSGTPGGVFSSTSGLSINTTTGEINPALSAPGVYTITYTIAPSAPCPGYITTATAEIVESPVISFPLATKYICSGESAVFAPSSTVTGTTYTWSVVGALPANIAGVSTGTASGNNPAISLSFTNTGVILQSLTIRVTPVNPSPVACSGVPYDLTLIVRPAVPAPVTDTANFCMDMPAAALHVDPLPGNTIRWYDENMVVLNAAPVINPAVPGLFKYYVTQFTGDGCESPASEIVAVVHLTAKIISATHMHPTACGVPSGSIILDVLDLNDHAIPNIPVVVHYNRFQMAYQFSGSTDASGRITIPLTAGTYSEIYVETSGSCTSQKIPDVFVLRDPTPPEQPVAGYNPPLCSGTELTLTALTPTSPQDGPIDYVWAGPAFGPFADTVRNTVITFPSVSVSDAGTYVVYAMQNNCISLAASFEVTILQAPAKPVIVTRTPLCVGEDLVLQASSSIPGNATLNYVWNGPGAGFPVGSSNAGINNIKFEDAGIYTVTVTSPQTGCAASSDTLIQVGGYPVVQFMQDTVALPTGYRLNLAPVITNATDPGILPMQNYTWTPSADISCNDAICSSVTATIKNNICYKVTATNIYGCSGSDDICINVFCESSQVFIPNAFAPTGNVPENRKLMVRATGINAVKSFRVFNRWGRIVFERSNFPPNSPDFGWDGTVNGKHADTGVYVYTVEVICENGVPYTFKGNVTLF